MNAPAQKQEHPLVAFKHQLDQRAEQFRSALPAHMPADRFQRVVLTAVQNNLDLLQADRQSVWNACMRAAQDGLLPDGREGAIVIYNTREKGGGWVKKAQWMPMVFGILKKVRNSGQLAMMTARVVYEGDNYRYWLDEEGEHVLYEPAEKRAANAAVRLAFAAARTKDGELLVEPLTIDEIAKIRSVSRAKDNGPWVDWWEEMAKKTAIRRLSKRLPMSSDLDDLVRRDDDLYDFQGARAERPRPAIIDLDGVGTDEKQTGEKPGAQETQSPDGRGSAGAGAPEADGGGGGKGQAPPADNITALEASIAKALGEAESPDDIKSVASLYGGEIADVSPDAQERIEALFDDAHARFATKQALADDFFPGDLPQPK